MRMVLHTWTDKAPVQSKHLGGGKNGCRCQRTPNFLEADLARVEILNCQFRILVKDRSSVFNVEESGS